jgi:myosin heavy subunit
LSAAVQKSAEKKEQKKSQKKKAEESPPPLRAAVGEVVKHLGENIQKDQKSKFEVNEDLAMELAKMQGVELPFNQKKKIEKLEEELEKEEKKNEKLQKKKMKMRDRLAQMKKRNEKLKKKSERLKQKNEKIKTKKEELKKRSEKWEWKFKEKTQRVAEQKKKLEKIREKKKREKTEEEKKKLKEKLMEARNKKQEWKDKWRKKVKSGTGKKMDVVKFAGIPATGGFVVTWSNLVVFAILVSLVVFLYFSVLKYRRRAQLHRKQHMDAIESYEYSPSDGDPSNFFVKVGSNEECESDRKDTDEMFPVKRTPESLNPDEDDEEIDWSPEPLLSEDSEEDLEDPP